MKRYSTSLIIFKMQINTIDAILWIIFSENKNRHTKNNNHLLDWEKRIGNMRKIFSQPAGGSINWVDYFGAQGSVVLS